MESDQHKHLQVQTPQTSICGISDPGRKRSENQDNIFLDEKGKFMLLADGMGGHERGSEASYLALDIIQKYLQPEVVSAELCDITEGSGVPVEVVCLLSLVDDAVHEANSVIYARNQELDLKRYMGTTLVGMALADGDFGLWFHVGDSRLYRWRDSTLVCLTTDHSAHIEWIRNGRTGAEPAKNVITRAIGPNEGVLAESTWEKWEKNDIYILCSDGLTDMVTEEQISGVLTDENDVNVIATHLVGAANEAGGKDNTSVIVCKV